MIVTLVQIIRQRKWKAMFSNSTWHAFAASVADGMGQAGHDSFCELMNMPTMNPKSYNNHLKQTDKTVMCFPLKTLLSKAVEKVKLALQCRLGQLWIFMCHTMGAGKKGGTSRCSCQVLAA